jgi:hypothetical protein
MSTSSSKYIPSRMFEVKDRKDRFAEMNRWVTFRNGWITSIPGEREVTVECLPTSTLPSELAKAGYQLQPADPPEGQRILPAAITEAVITEGSTVPNMMQHTGIVQVLRYSFPLSFF